MPEADIDRRYDYSPEYLAEILRSVKTIAMVGASPDETKFSYSVLRQLNEIGYDILPVNPNPLVTEIRGLRVWRSLDEIDRPVDMVDVFRPPRRALWHRGPGHRHRRQSPLGPDRHLRRPGGRTGRSSRFEGRHGPLPQDRTVPSILEAPTRSRNLTDQPQECHIANPDRLSRTDDDASRSPGLACCVGSAGEGGVEGRRELGCGRSAVAAEVDVAGCGGDQVLLTDFELEPIDQRR